MPRLAGVDYPAGDERLTTDATKMVRTRFAPSPTGYLHIGGVRTALFNWLYARKHGGQFLLRIDDTDQQRNVQESLQPILDGFRWLGIDWDEGPGVDGPHAPYYQSQRTDRYTSAAQILLERGLAYRDYSTAAEMAELRETAEKAKRDFVYDRRWAAESKEDEERFLAEGRRAVIRLKMPREGLCEFRDLVCGEMKFAWNKEADHVIERADGSAIYHLASVVDDHDFEITHVIRGGEHLSNTPRQIFIAQGLGYALPEYAHVPAVSEPGGKPKLSKRKIAQYVKNREFKKLLDEGVAIAKRIGIETTPDSFNPVLTAFYQQVGYLPDAIVNYLVLLGWSLDGETEDLTREQMIGSFSLERVNSAPAQFDPQKLNAFQQRHMDRLPAETKTRMAMRFLQAADLVSDATSGDVDLYLERILKSAADRMKVAGDVLQFDDFFVADDAFGYDEKAYQKRLVKPDDAGELLLSYREHLAQVDFTGPVDLETDLKAFVEAKGIKIGQIIHALRVAVTGKAVGFGMFETLDILGKERCLRRIDRTLAQLADN